MGYNRTVLHVSIIIVDYNSHQLTLDCLKSLEEQANTKFNWNVVLIDNGSKEMLVLPKELSPKRYELIRSAANLGFTGGNNLGIYHAIEKYNSDYVLLLNNDTEVDKDFLKNIVRCAEDDHQQGIVSAKIYFSPGSEYHTESYDESELGNVLWYAGGSVDWRHMAAFHRGVDEVDRGQFDEQDSCDFATGCAMLIRREVLEKVGPFDKRFFLYMEDVDLSLRAAAAGYELGFCPSAVVWHKNAGSSGGPGTSVADYYQTRNKLLLASKHGDWMAWLTALRLAVRDLTGNNDKKRLGVLHAIAGKFGKQPVV